MANIRKKSHFYVAIGKKTEGVSKWQVRQTLLMVYN